MKYMIIVLFLALILCMTVHCACAVPVQANQQSMPVIDITSLGTDIISPVKEGTGISISDHLINNGDADATTFAVTYYLSLDKRLSDDSTKIGSQIIYGLPKGDELIADVYIDLPAGLKPGLYYFFKYIDEEGTLPYEYKKNNIWYNEEPVEIIPTEEEKNQETLIIPDTPPKIPNTISLTDVAFEPVAFIGEAFVPSGTLYNGLNNMVPVIQVTYYLSKTKGGVPKGQHLGDWKEMQVKPDETRSLEKVLKIPQNTIPGYYYIAATIEAIGVSGFRDNSWVSPEPIQVKYSPDAPFPDLTHIKFDIPDCANPGGDITVTDTISNIGNTCADNVIVEYYLSIIPEFDQTALLIGQWNVGSICPGEQMTETLALPISDSNPLGMYYIFAVIDPCDDPCVGIAELDEENNIIMRSIELCRCVFCS